MSLRERLEADFKEALKKKEAGRVSALRLVKAAITNLEKEKSGVKITDAKVAGVIARAVKKGKEAILEFKKGGRDDLVQKEEKELKYLTGYLPKQLSEKEVAEKVKEVIAQTGAKTPQDIGKVMGLTMKALAGQADGSQVKDIVQKLLSS